MLEGEHTHPQLFEKTHRRSGIDAVVLEDDVPDPALSDQRPSAFQHLSLVALHIDLDQLHLPLTEDVVQPGKLDDEVPRPAGLGPVSKRGKTMWTLGSPPPLSSPLPLSLETASRCASAVPMEGSSFQRPTFRSSSSKTVGCGSNAITLPALPRRVAIRFVT